ncbi:MAG TPA: AAA family ATPase [Chloroflexia bacterium]|nr:AAA family ATPase [Chloroflexia bacterium]
MSYRPLQRENLDYLLTELRRVSALVSARVEEIRAANPNEDEFRGLYISDEEVDSLLYDPALFLAEHYATGITTDSGSSTGSINAPLSRLSQLKRVFNLSSFEVDVLLIALAPELDLRYEKIYAYLQDDVTRRRPSVDLVLRLLCPGLAGQLAARRYFDPDATLLNYRLLDLGEENQKQNPSLLARSIRLDDGMVSYLLGEDKLDSRLRSLVEVILPDATGLIFEDAEQYVQRLVEQSEKNYISILSGSDEMGKRQLAAEVCQRLDIPLLLLDVQIVVGLPKAENLLRLLERELHLRGAALFLTSYDLLLEDTAASQEARKLVTRLLKDQTGLCFISTGTGLPPLLAGSERTEFQLRLNMPSYSERQHLWERLLGAEAIGLDLEGLSSRFRLNSGQIAGAIATARHMAAWRGETAPTLADLEAACRSHSSQRLSSLARKITPKYSWSDLVLPVDQLTMLREICDQVKHRSLVYEKWGFDRKISLGKGLNMVFAGPSGTGKTMSAEVIGNELKMDIYKIDLSNMVSKYIGETEKNLERIFNEAGESNAILFFDEADSIFGKRSEVKDAHDRYANIETGYLLQKMEEYDGIVILATNLRKNMDEAFVRRMHFVLEYPFPEEEDRFQIWKKVFPPVVPLGDSVDMRFIARQFKLAGGNIKNVALAAAFMAASEAEQSVEMVHLIRAVRREFQKMGKLITQADFGPYFSLLTETDSKTIR